MFLLILINLNIQRLAFNFSFRVLGNVDLGEVPQLGY